MLDHGPVTQPGEFGRAHPSPPDPTDDRRLRRKIDQQQLALAHLSEALVRLRCGTEALREENRELRRELEAAHGRRNLPAAGGHSHAGRIDEILRRSPS
jgi:hypothetical protein